MSRRDEIRMTPPEVGDFLDAQRIVTVATVGPGGRPHLMPLWFIPAGAGVLAWTYGASQKIKNLERVPQATLQFEAGVSYEELRGVMMECDVELIRDFDAVRDVGLRIALRYAPGPPAGETAPPELQAFIDRQARKRVVMRFTPTRTVSWDHSKLGGAY